jgi:hypothetical protein
MRLALRLLMLIVGFFSFKGHELKYMKLFWVDEVGLGIWISIDTLDF